MTITRFIERAIEGGWGKQYCPGQVTSYGFYAHDNKTFGEGPRLVDYREVILDPLAWKAVGKVEGWISPKKYPLEFPSAERSDYMEEWLWHQHRMIDAIAEGQSIEGFISTL